MGDPTSNYSTDMNRVRATAAPDDAYSRDSKNDIMSKNAPDDSVLPINFPRFFKDRDILIYPDQNVVIVVIDGTGSMGDDTFIIRDKIVLLQGQLERQGYLKNPMIMICIVGDAYSDRWPLQVCRPARGDALIKEIEKTYPEGYGGAQHFESYELMAEFLLKHVLLPGGGEDPFVFWFGDEGIHSPLNPSQVREFIGDSVESMDSKNVFEKLCEKFNVWYFHRKYYIEDLDEGIIEQWKDCIGAERVLKIETPKAVVDYMLGIIATVTGSRTVDGYLDDLRGKGKDPDRIQDPDRIKEVGNLLDSAKGALVPITDVPKLPSVGDDTIKRKSGSGRL